MTLLAAAAASTTAPPPVLIPTPSRALIFEDDFDGPLDETTWARFKREDIQFGQEGDYTGEADLVYTENSNLVVRAIRTAPNQWRAGRVQTGGRRHFWYGRYEARMKLPTGKGTWPAWWTLGATEAGAAGWGWEDRPGVSWPHCGEIDIMEHLNASPRTIANAHWSTGSAGVLDSPSLDVTQWHVYACEWTSDKVDFYLDDTKFATFDTNVATSTTATTYLGSSNAFRRPHQLIINLAMGGWPGPSDASTPSPSDVLVDWVKVWGLDDQRYENVPVLGLSLNRSALVVPVNYPSPGNYNKEAGIPLVETLMTPEGLVPHDPTVYWASSDESVATAGGGRVIGRSPGTCIVTATTRDGGYTATCTVTVTS